MARGPVKIELEITVPDGVQPEEIDAMIVQKANERVRDGKASALPEGWEIIFKEFTEASGKVKTHFGGLSDALNKSGVGFARMIALQSGGDVQLPSGGEAVAEEFEEEQEEIAEELAERAAIQREAELTEEEIEERDEREAELRQKAEARRKRGKKAKGRGRKKKTVRYLYVNKKTGKKVQKATWARSHGRGGRYVRRQVKGRRGRRVR